MILKKPKKTKQKKKKQKKKLAVTLIFSSLSNHYYFSTFIFLNSSSLIAALYTPPTLTNSTLRSGEVFSHFILGLDHTLAVSFSLCKFCLLLSLNFGILRINVWQFVSAVGVQNILNLDLDGAKVLNPPLGYFVLHSIQQFCWKESYIFIIY